MPKYSLLMKGICSISIVPVRSDASDKAEIVTQLLFGELVEIIVIRKEWTYIRCEWDGYEGWCDTKQVQVLSDDHYYAYRLQHATCFELVQPALSQEFFQPLTLGAVLPFYDGLSFSVAGSRYNFSGQTIPSATIKATSELIVRIARKFLFAPYLWGGRSPFGIDCSGLTQVVYKMAGIRLLRDAAQQVTQGRLVDFVEQAQAGDLAFFENSIGRIAHVGIVLPGNKIIHAHGWVRIDTIDHFGIFNEEKKVYTHNLRLVRRLLPDMETAEDFSPALVQTEQVRQIELF